MSLAAWIADARAALAGEHEDWVVIATLSKARALLGPSDALATRWRAMHDAYCAGTLDGAAALDELAATPASELGHPPTAIGRDRFARRLVSEHCDTGDNVDRLVEAGHARNARAAAQYGPAYVLAWSQVPAELAPLLELALGEDLPAPDAIERAIVAARGRFGRLAIDPAALDGGSLTAWIQGLSDQLAAADLAEVAAKPGGKPARGAARPDAPAAPPPDWAAIERDLLAAVLDTLARHAKRKAPAPLAQLALDANPPYEPVLIALDTVASFERTRAAVMRTIEARRAKELRGAEAWRRAREQLRPGELDDALHDPSEFAHHDAGTARLRGLEAYVDRGNPPAPRRDGEPWSHGQTRLVLWRVLDQLASHRALRAKHIARPFYLISSLHDERPVIVRVVVGRG